MEEIWKDIKGFEGLYQISNLQRIKSLIRKNITIERILSPRIGTHGYIEIGLSKKKKLYFKKVHRLIGIAFIPNPENKEQINHINCINTIRKYAPWRKT